MQPGYEIPGLAREYVTTGMKTEYETTGTYTPRRPYVINYPLSTAPSSSLNFFTMRARTLATSASVSVRSGAWYVRR